VTQRFQEARASAARATGETKARAQARAQAQAQAAPPKMLALAVATAVNFAAVATVASTATFVAVAQAGFIQRQEFGVGNTLTISWGDVDRDGDLDAAVVDGGVPKSLYVNDGAGDFTIVQQWGGASQCFAMVFGDCDNDGDLDLAEGRGAGLNALHTNDGGGNYTTAPPFSAVARRTVTAAWADYDRDGDLDLATGNGILGATRQNYLYINNGNGTWTEQAQFGMKDTASLAWADCDNDGDLDMAVGNWNADGCALYTNNGDGSFTASPAFGARDTNAISWGDADNDGDLDCATANGDFTSAEQNYLYLNNGDGSFTEVAEFGLGSTDGLSWGDVDNDGDLDVAAANEHSPNDNYLFLNDTDSSDGLTVELAGRFHAQGAGYSNRDGIGARVEVYEAGFAGLPEYRLGVREICAQSGFAPQNQMGGHFGLPGRTTVDLRIVWPGSAGARITQIVPGVPVGTKTTVTEQLTATSVEPDGPQGPHGPQDPHNSRTTGLRLVAFPNPSTGAVRLDLRDVALAERIPEASVAIYNAAGSRVALLRLNSGAEGARFALWDARLGDGHLAASGVYFARVWAERPSTEGLVAEQSTAATQFLPQR